MENRCVFSHYWYGIPIYVKFIHHVTQIFIDFFVLAYSPCALRGAIKSLHHNCQFFLFLCYHFYFIYFKVMLFGLHKILNCCVFDEFTFYSSYPLSLFS